MTTSVTDSLTPGRRDRDWRLRWELLLAQLLAITGPRMGERNANEINAAAQEVHQFFISAHHLKNALIEDGVISSETVEDAIDKSPTLALLADLANLDKHRRMRRPPRSGAVPVIESVSDISSDDTWRLRMVIGHKGQRHDGAAFAEQAIEAWRIQLDKWGLLT